jgi:alpha-amylase
VAATYEELGDFTEEPFELVSLADDLVVARRCGTVAQASGPRPLAVEKMFRFGGSRLEPVLELTTKVENMGDAAVAVELAVEWNVNLLGGGHNPAAYYETEDAVRTPHDAAADLPAASRIAFGNDYEGVRVEATVEPVARLTWYPVETVSNSEGGFERVYQGSSLLFRWPVTLAPGEARAFAVHFVVAQTIDHAMADLG